MRESKRINRCARRDELTLPISKLRIEAGESWKRYLSFNDDSLISQLLYVEERYYRKSKHYVGEIKSLTFSECPSLNGVNQYRFISADYSAYRLENGRYRLEGYIEWSNIRGSNLKQSFCTISGAEYAELLKTQAS